MSGIDDDELKKLLGLLIFGGGDDGSAGVSDDGAGGVGSDAGGVGSGGVGAGGVGAGAGGVGSEAGDDAGDDGSDAGDDVSDDGGGGSDAGDAGSDAGGVGANDTGKIIEEMEKEKEKGIQEYTNIFDAFLKIINNEATSNKKELLKVNPVIDGFLSNLSFKNMIKFYNDYEHEIVLKILYIFELYKNIIKINNEKNRVLSNVNLEKYELYKKLLIEKKNNIDELTKLANFEQAKPYLDTAIRYIFLNLDKVYNDEELYNIIEESKKIPPPPPSSSTKSSSSQDSTKLSSLPPPPPTQKEVLIIKPLTNKVQDVNNKVIDFHEGLANDKMKYALFGEQPNYTEFFKHDKSITSKEFNDVTKKKYDYIWIAGPIFINKTFNPKTDSIEILKSLLKKDGRIIFTLPTSVILDLRKKNEFNNTIKIKDLYWPFLRKPPVSNIKNYNEYQEKHNYDIFKKEIDELTTIFNQNFDYIKNDGYRMYKLKDNIEIIEGIIGKLISEQPGVVFDQSMLEGIISEIISQISLKNPGVVFDQSMLEGIISEIISQISLKIPGVVFDQSMLEGIIGQILAGTRPKPIMDSDELIKGIIGEILAGTTPTSTPKSTMDSDELFKGIIGQILAGTTSTSLTPSPSMLSRVSSFFSKLSSLPSAIGNFITSLVKSIIINTKNLIILTTNVTSGAVVVGVGAARATVASATLIAAISLGTLLSLGYTGVSESFNLIKKIPGYIYVPRVEMNAIWNNAISAIEGNKASIKELLEYAAKGTVGIALIPFGLAIGVLYGLGLVGQEVLRKTVSTVISRPKIGIIKDHSADQEYIDSIASIHNNDNLRKRYKEDQKNEMDNLSDSVLNDTIELVESLKKHHIIDKILDEPIMYSEYNKKGPNLVADIKIIRDDSEETNDLDSSNGEIPSKNKNNYNSDIIKRILKEPDENIRDMI